MCNLNEMYGGDMERKLERQFQKLDRFKKRAYICSPLSEKDAEGQLRNMKYAQAYMLYANEALGYLARAPNAYPPMLLCDKLAAERALALEFGLHLLELSDILLVYGLRISSGMKGEILRAALLGIPIVVYDGSVYLEFRKLVTRSGVPKTWVSLDDKNPVTGDLDPITDRLWQVMCDA